MNENALLQLLEKVKAGELPTAKALAELKAGPFQCSSLGDAELDHHRSLRHGLGEVVFGETKTVDQILKIAERLSANGKTVLLTRLNEEKSAALLKQHPEARNNLTARTVTIHAPKARAWDSHPFVACVSAGTSDASVLEEAVETCRAFDVAVCPIQDVGVTGLHRLLAHVQTLQRATAIVVVAGMEGALVSVVAGLVGCPVFAVPTSVGYGVHLGGLTPLLTMLNSCAPGVSVVNIDNGFSAAFSAASVVRKIYENRTL